MLPQLLKNILILIEVITVFNLMIVVHELGHFLAAKWRGMVIEKFGIWFGKPLWKKTVGGIEYSLGTIPFGGFVALPQMASMEVMEGKTETPCEQLPKASALDKIIVAFAGPLFSFGLAVVFAGIVWLVGRPVSESQATTTVGYVAPDSPAEKAGLQVGDKILSVDGQPVHRFEGFASDSISWRVVRSEGDTIPVTAERIVNGKPEVVSFNPRPEIEQTKPWMRKALREIGIAPAQRPMVAQVEAGSVADKAGLRPNDVISAVNGAPAYTMEVLMDYLKDHPAQTYTLQVERDRKMLDLPFSPQGGVVKYVSPKSPAEEAGLQAGDTINAVDGERMPDAQAITAYIISREGKPVRFTIQNGKGAREVTITPRIPKGEKTPRIGIEWDLERPFGIAQDSYGKFHLLHPSPAEQVGTGIMTIVNTVSAIASRKSDIKLQHMGGPFMMFRVYYMFFQSREGWRLALWFSVVLNVNLAIINLLPIPVLDGGHITLALIEAIRRRPVNVHLLEIIQTSCAVLIIGFMLYIAFFDVQDYFGPGHARPQFDAKDTAPAQSQR